MKFEKKIEVWWDDQDPNNPGWYAKILQYNEEEFMWEFVDDSQKVWFGVDLDQFLIDQEDDVYQSLLEVYPDHVIIFL